MTSRVFVSQATNPGSSNTIPLPLTYITILVVPKSIPISVVHKSATFSKNDNFRGSRFKEVCFVVVPKGFLRTRRCLRRSSCVLDSFRLLVHPNNVSTYPF